MTSVSQKKSAKSTSPHAGGQGDVGGGDDPSSLIEAARGDVLAMTRIVVLEGDAGVDREAIVRRLVDLHGTLDMLASAIAGGRS